MTKKILNKKGLFNHYIHNQNNNELSKKEKTQATLDSSIQNSNNPKKANWKKVNIRMTIENYNAIKIHAILNNLKLEDLFDQVISDFINKKT